MANKDFDMTKVVELWCGFGGFVQFEKAATPLYTFENPSYYYTLESS